MLLRELPVLPPGDTVALDLETTGLLPHRDHLVLISLAVADTPFVVDVRSQAPEQIRAWLLEQIWPRSILVHNSIFDIVFLAHQLQLPWPAQVWDTRLAEQLLLGTAQRGSALADVAQRRLGVTLDKSLQHSFTLDEPISDAQVSYAAMDTLVLAGIAQQQQEELRREGLWLVAALEHAALPVYWAMQRAGIGIDAAVLHELLEQYQHQREQYEATLQQQLFPAVQAVRRERLLAKQQELQAWQQGCDAFSAQIREAWQRQDWEGIRDLLGSWEASWQDPKKGEQRVIRAAAQRYRQLHPRPPSPREDTAPVRLRSPQELLAALAEACRLYGVPVPKDTSTSSLTALLGHSRAFDTLILAPLLRFKELDKLCQFCEQIQEHATDTPAGLTLYPDWNQVGTETGRTTSRNPNLQGQPKAGGFRRIFRARPGTTLICADYSQIELRVMAALSGDPEMLEAFQSGRDLHRLTASRIFGVPEDAVTAEQRSIGKRVNFGTLYGMGPRRLQEALRSEGVAISLEEARHALETWRATYQQAAQSIAAWGDDAWVRGYAATALGRIRRFTQEHGDEARVRREGGNHVIQGTAADLMKLAMVRVAQALPQATPVAQVHDELVLEVPAADAEELATLVEQEFLAAAREILGDHVPVAVEVHVGQTWHEAKEE